MVDMGLANVLVAHVEGFCEIAHGRKEWLVSLATHRCADVQRRSWWDRVVEAATDCYSQMQMPCLS